MSVFLHVRLSHDEREPDLPTTNYRIKMNTAIYDSGATGEFNIYIMYLRMLVMYVSRTDHIKLRLLTPRTTHMYKHRVLVEEGVELIHIFF